MARGQKNMGFSRAARFTIVSRSISGLVVEYIVAIDVTRVRFPADALFRYRFHAPGLDLGLRRAPLRTTPNGGL